MATVTLITGPTGAGKTTHARKLCDQTGALRFSIDEWMAALFGADTPGTLTFDWAIERVGRCEVQIQAVGSQLLGAGMDVVLDLGFTTGEQRDRFRKWAQAQGAQVILHFVTTEKPVRFARVQRRNRDRSETFAFEVTAPMFEFMENRFQAPSAAETPVTFVT